MCVLCCRIYIILSMHNNQILFNIIHTHTHTIHIVCGCVPVNIYIF